MGRAEVGTAKHQAKQLKASGLQKLRFYCQLCEKQCRDANGFKNHLSSPSHRGRVSNLSEKGSSSSVIEEYSRTFKRDFLRLLRINHGTKKINANKFYQEYILNDKNHVHMNSTRWSSLTSFIKHLGTSGDVRVEQGGNEEDELNFDIRLIDKSSESQLKLQLASKREKGLKTDDDIAMKLINEQIKRGKEKEESLTTNVLEQKPLDPKPLSKPIKLSIKKVSKPKKASVFGNDSDDD